MFKLGLVLCLGVLFFNGCSSDDETTSSGGAAGQSGGGKTSGGTSSGGKLGDGGKVGTGGAPSGGTSPSGGAGGGSAGDEGNVGGAAGHSATGGVGGFNALGGGSSCPDAGSVGGQGGEGGEGLIEGCEGATISKCPPAIDNNEQLEALRGVGVIQGNLTLTGDVNDLAALRCLRRVTGSLSVWATRLNDFKGLENLERVDKDVHLGVVAGGSSQLGSLNGLEGLARIGGSLSIGQEALLIHDSSGLCCIRYYESPPVASLSALHNLRSARRVFIARTALRDLDGLQGLSQLESLVLVNMSRLETLHGLEGLTRVYGQAFAYLEPAGLSASGGVLIGNDARLENVTALSALRQVTSVNVSYNEQLSDVRGLANLQGAASFSVNDNKVLDTCQVNEVVAQIEVGGDIGTTSIARNAACAQP